MTQKVRHVIGISGGKDSAALAIYLRNNYPQLDLEYYFCDTGKELNETYTLINNLESYLGVKIKKLNAAEDSHKDPFDHFLEVYGGYLPSSTARWCTKKLKLEPFEDFIGNTPVVSYVGIRGDEDREGYISKKPNIQSIFPFRKNIWSEDVIAKVLDNKQIKAIKDLYKEIAPNNLDRINEVLNELVSEKNNQTYKLHKLLDLGIKEFNKVVFRFLKETNYPLALEEDFPLLDNEDILIREDIFKLLRDSNVGVPKYYEKIEFEFEGKKGEYARSRSGCFFCFYQQKIEWIWLYENHLELFNKAMQYEKDGFTWNQNERLEDLIHPNRIAQIKRDHLNRSGKEKSNKSQFLIDILDDTESKGCISCFI